MFLLEFASLPPAHRMIYGSGLVLLLLANTSATPIDGPPGNSHSGYTPGARDSRGFRIGSGVPLPPLRVGISSTAPQAHGAPLPSFSDGFGSILETQGSERYRDPKKTQDVSLPSFSNFLDSVRGHHNPTFSHPSGNLPPVVPRDRITGPITITGGFANSQPGSSYTQATKNTPNVGMQRQALSQVFPAPTVTPGTRLRGGKRVRWQDQYPHGKTSGPVSDNQQKGPKRARTVGPTPSAGYAAPATEAPTTHSAPPNTITEKDLSMTLRDLFNSPATWAALMDHVDDIEAVRYLLRDFLAATSNLVNTATARDLCIAQVLERNGIYDCIMRISDMYESIVTALENLALYRKGFKDYDGLRKADSSAIPGMRITFGSVLRELVKGSTVQVGCGSHPVAGDLSSYCRIYGLMLNMYKDLMIQYENAQKTQTSSYDALKEVAEMIEDSWTVLARERYNATQMQSIHQTSAVHKARRKCAWSYGRCSGCDPSGLCD